MSAKDRKQTLAVYQEINMIMILGVPLSVNSGHSLFIVERRNRYFTISDSLVRLVTIYSFNF
jgi:hypothetical protein